MLHYLYTSLLRLKESEKYQLPKLGVRATPIFPFGQHWNAVLNTELD